MGPDRVLLGLAVVALFAVVYAAAGRRAAAAPDEVHPTWRHLQAAGVLIPFVFTLYFADRAELGPDLDAIAEEWRAHVAAVLEEATLKAPEGVHMVDGGRAGLHGESFGFLVAEMQHLQRAIPGATW